MAVIKLNECLDNFILKNIKLDEEYAVYQDFEGITEELFRGTEEECRDWIEEASLELEEYFGDEWPEFYMEEVESDIDEDLDSDTNIDDQASKAKSRLLNRTYKNNDLPNPFRTLHRDNVKKENIVDECINECIITEDGNNVDLSTVKGSIANIIKEHNDEICKCTTKTELLRLFTTLFQEADLNTPGSERFLNIIAKSKDYIDALSYVYNSFLKGANHGSIESEFHKNY